MAGTDQLPPYPGQPYPQSQPPQRSAPVKSGFSIAALCCGVFAAIFALYGPRWMGLVLGAAAIPCAVHAIRQFNRGVGGGRGMAVWGLILGVFCVPVGLASILSSPPAATVPAPTASPSAPSTQSETPTTDSAPGPSPEQAARAAGLGTVQGADAAVAAALGTSNRNVSRIISSGLSDGTYTVHFNINENLTDGMTRLGARTDVLGIIKAVRAAGLQVQALAVTGAYPMTDLYGNTTNDDVLSLVYSAATLNRINPDGVNFWDTDNLYVIADQEQVVPALRSGS